MASKSERTRAHLLEVALRLFAERGFEATTMRAIADEAGMATGAAYYHFKGKDDFVVALFEHSLDGDADVVDDLLCEPDSERLRGYVRWKLDVLAPHHDALGQLMGRMLTPRSSLSPFGPETAALRDRDIANFARLIVGEGRAVYDGERRRARALWLAWMGTLMLWLHDDKPEREERALARFAQVSTWIAGPLWPAFANVVGPAFDSAWREFFEGEAP